MCPGCRHPIASCRCLANRARPAGGGDGIARVRRETGGRGGKTVTTVAGLDIDDAALISLSKRMKAACGTGGAVKDGVIELQGDHRDTVIAMLTKDGIRSKRAGG